MSKYVNADKLTQVLQGIRVSGAKVLDFNDALDWVCDVIGELPVVEVVRCKDCIHGIENGELCGQKVYLCSCMTNPNEFYGDFYCASGERKESKIKKCFDIPKEVAERLLENTERKETE